jgi:hypothetical protein
MDFLVDIHSWNRWIVLLALLGAGVLGLGRSLQNAPWEPGSDRPFALVTILFDLQVAIGIVLWIGNNGWEQDFFIKVIHPLGMLVALGVAHLAVAGARKRSGSAAYRFVGIGLLAALVIVALVVPHYAWF